MYVIFPAEEVVYFTYVYPEPPRPRTRPTLDALPTRPDPVEPASFTTASNRPHSDDIFNYGVSDVEIRISPSPSTVGTRAPSLDRPSSSASTSRTKDKKPKVKIFKNFGRSSEENDFGKITRSPNPDNFELPAPLPTPAFSRHNIFDRNFDALFEVAHEPHFNENVRVSTPEPSRELDVTADHFFPTPELSPASSVYHLPPRPYSAPHFTSQPEREMTPSCKHSSFEETKSKPKKVSFIKRLIKKKEQTPDRRSGNTMNQPVATCEMVLRDLTHPLHNEELKNHNAVSFKLVKTVSDFTSQLSQLYEQHSSQLQVLVSTFRKKNAELRKERASCPSSLFHTWETLLQEVEADVVSTAGTAANLDRKVASPLLDKTFHLKMQARKVFAHRDGCEAILSKADDKLAKTRLDYKSTFISYSSNPNPNALAAYYDAHNTYVQQLIATNAMLEQYNQYTLPTLLQELEEVYTDLTACVSEAISTAADAVSEKCIEQQRRYESLSTQARAISSTADLAHLARTLLTAQPGITKQARRSFMSPHQPMPDDPLPLDLPQENLPPVLRNEMIMERLSGQQIRASYEQLRKDGSDLEMQLKQLQETMDALIRAQTRSLEGGHYTKINELQEEISLKKYDYRAAQLHLASIRAQQHVPTRIKMLKNTTYLRTFYE